MKYMLLVYDDEKMLAQMPETERQTLVGDYLRFSKEIRESGHYKASAPLQPTSKATTVRMRNGRRMVNDGPFADTHEQLGGYYLVEARDLDEAIGIASRIPSARTGTIEVRPVMAQSPEP